MSGREGQISHRYPAASSGPRHVKPLEPNSDRLEPASPTVPAPTENDHQDDENDQKRRVVHLCLPVAKPRPARAVSHARFLLSC